MKNTILNYELEELDEFFVSDYFSKKVTIHDLFYSLDDYIDTYIVQNDDKFERIALELYGNMDYWDILLMLNDKNPMFEMPYSYDLLVNFAVERTNFYQQVLYSDSPLEEPRTTVLFNEILANSEKLNEEYRIISIIKPERMNNFISLLKVEGYV